MPLLEIEDVTKRLAGTSLWTGFRSRSRQASL